MLKRTIAENLYRWEEDSFAPPAQISITPTNLCNLKCQSCWQRDKANHSNSHNKPMEIPEEKLYSIIREASELGVRCVELTGGGEPLVRKTATIQLIREIKNKSMIGWMTSNGTLFSLDIIKLMIELEWDKLTLSLDGPDSKTNDFLRPPAGTFEKVINVLDLFNEYKKLINKDTPEITFNVVVSKYNIDRLAEIIRLASQYRVRGVTFEPIKDLSSECKKLLVDFEKEYGRIMKELKKAQVVSSKNNIFTNIDGLILSPELIKYSGKFLNGIPAKNFNGGESKLLGVPCIEPWFHIYLEADGNVRPCCVSPGFNENIYSRSLRDIWFGEKFSSFRDAIISKNYPSFCNQCNANLICFSKEIQKLLKNKLSSESARQAIDDAPSRNIETQISRDEGQKQIKMVITDTAPLYPPLWGGPKRIWNLYSNFSKDLFDITYVGVGFGLKTSFRYSYNKIRHNFKEILCLPSAHYYPWHIFERIFFRNSSFDLFVYLWMHTDFQFKYVLDSQAADIIICSHPWSSLCVNKRNKQLFIYDAHNCEYSLMEQILKRHPLKRFILMRVKKIEADACGKSDLILVCSENEKKDFMDLYNVDASKIVIIPNGSNINGKENKTTKAVHRNSLSLAGNDKVIIFIGAYYKPNIDAARFILEKIAPHLNEFKILIVGTASEPFVTKQIPSNIRLTGKVSDEQLDALLSTSDIAINPMFDGAGVNIKMLDYMAYGLPIVTTECGARGIETYNKQPFIISSPEKFIDNIKMIALDEQLHKQMSDDGKGLISQYYSWDLISKKLQRIILDKLKYN